MNRRDFLSLVGALGVTMTWGSGSALSHNRPCPEERRFPPGMLVIDAHAHPDQLYNLSGNIMDDPSSTLQKIRDLRMAASSFAAIGDFSDTPLTFAEVMLQLETVITPGTTGQVRIIRRHSDLHPFFHRPEFIPGAILALEGAGPLGSTFQEISENLDLLYTSGVRMITLLHRNDNQFGWGMHNSGKDVPGLTDLGRTLVERMISRGIVIDVAHAHYAALKDIAEIALAHGVPIIDSHTSLSPHPEPTGSRLRTWEEMEIIAGTGGLICTWPLRWESAPGGPSRLTLQDWAEENCLLMDRLGSGHVALGTDGGGLLPAMVEGYESILDLPNLIEAMAVEGVSRMEINRYTGDNLIRIIQKCVG